MRQGRPPVLVQDERQLCGLFEVAVGTDALAAQIQATAAAAASEQKRLDRMATELDE